MDIRQIYSPKEGEAMRLAIFMSGTGSNAKKIIERYDGDRGAGNPSFKPVFMFTDNPGSNAYKISAGLAELSFCCNSIRGFYSARGRELDDMGVRAEYDDAQLKLLRSSGIDAVALAGYDWVLTPSICINFVTVNVHPGDLRVVDEGGRRKYIGLGWVPSAKAILAGDNEVYTSVHLVTSELDGGPLLKVSEPQPVPDEVKSLENRAILLGEAKSIRGILRFIKNNPGAKDEEIGRRFPIYKHAKDCQERLKVHGDWVIFPQAISDIAGGKYSRDDEGNMRYEGNLICQSIRR